MSLLPTKDFRMGSTGKRESGKSREKRVKEEASFKLSFNTIEALVRARTHNLAWGPQDVTLKLPFQGGRQKRSAPPMSPQVHSGANQPKCPDRGEAGTFPRRSKHPSRMLSLPKAGGSAGRTVHPRHSPRRAAAGRYPPLRCRAGCVLPVTRRGWWGPCAPRALLPSGDGAELARTTAQRPPPTFSRRCLE